MPFRPVESLGERFNSFLRQFDSVIVQKIRLHKKPQQNHLDILGMIVIRESSDLQYDIPTRQNMSPPLTQSLAKKPSNTIPPHRALHRFLGNDIPDPTAVMLTTRRFSIRQRRDNLQKIIPDTSARAKNPPEFRLQLYRGRRTFSSLCAHCSYEHSSYHRRPHRSTKTPLVVSVIKKTALSARWNTGEIQRCLNEDYFFFTLTARRLRPLARRLLIILRPPGDLMRLRNPCLRARFRFFG